SLFFFSCIHTPISELSTLSLHDALPIFEDLLEHEDIQAVVVATPSRFHASVTRLAAVAGKHVFCEKPPALLMEEAESAMSAVAEDRKSTRLNSSHRTISYAVFCLKKKKK